MKIIVVVVIGLLFVGNVWNVVKNRKLRSQTQLQAVELSTLKDSVSSFKDENGQLVSKLASTEVEKRNLKESLELIGLDVKKLKEQNVKWRKITEVLTLKLESTGSGESTVIDTFYIEKNTTDTVRYTHIGDWTNNYLSLYNARIQSDKFTFDYRYNAGINLIIEGKRRSPVVTATLTDPNANITHGKSISVPFKTKWYEKPWLWGAAGFLTGILIE